MPVTANLVRVWRGARYVTGIVTSKGGESVVIKRGRPFSENPKDYMLQVRMDMQMLAQLDECCKAANLSRSGLVRKCIKETYDKLKK